ncbi:oligopeptidase A [Pseudomonas granadensis]|uniref:M3 family metallopeptidase n=1 Tax=Pseudomonas granadensis TaxID=1421430 RepID=UPI0019CFE65D|nr:M3 family metallopeptidase [Pseudomonas granadensis]MBN6772361.1 oligopeptidase A [Pseudomonas granadensis]MBN6802863.1 oligopeptidase A [Pseudomonas granadensis]MBN6830212.1 oligopeptidase A [Pseudomonas granadensis]MBN6837084.1 oligopeptidase A [Pseudomonas granadensis]MBN6865730.1 oligopeptidase A [Pseudomonas granadensis]
MPSANPLLQRWQLPAWSKIQAEHLVPAFDAIVADNQRIIAEVIATQTVHPNWDDLVIAIDEADARIAEAIAIIEVLDTVKGTDADWLAQSAQCSLIAKRYRAQKFANLALYRTYQGLERSPIAASFDAFRKASLAKTLLGFRLTGIELPAEQRERLAAITVDIDLQQQLFLINLERSNAAWTRQIDEFATLDGLSAAFKDQLLLNARQAGKTGWLLTLDRSTYEYLMKNASDRRLREAYFVAFNTRASDQGPHADRFDNGPVLQKLLALRHEEARLLGFESFAHLRLSQQMAASPVQVEAFLKQQIAHNQAVLQQDTQALQAFAATQGVEHLQAWDYDYFAEQWRQQHSSSALKGLRQYFALDETLSRFCQFVEHLFGIKLTERKDLSHWHESVRLVEVSEYEQVIGFIYLDLFHHQDAPDYAMTHTVRDHRINAEGRPAQPIAVLHCNLPSISGGHQYLLSHKGLRVLFHEFGHCLQHVLTRSPHHNLSGISQMARDSGEFAGQLFEQLSLSEELLQWLSKHHENRVPLNRAQITSALAAIAAHTSRDTATLLLEALLDLELHRSEANGRNVQQCFDAVLQQIPQLNLPAYCRFANRFDYLVTGYEASVYAYKWSGVLASEAFKRVEREGVFNPQTGRDLREAFFSGDSVSLPDAMEKFLGKPVPAELFAAQPD